MSRLKSCGIAAVCAAVLCLAPFVFDAPAGAGPGSYHTVAGSGAQYEPGGCGAQWHYPPTFCGAAYGDTFSIDASDRAGAHGSMRLNQVNIALTCVTIVHATSGHTVYASGTGTDGKRYFATVSVPITTGSFVIGNDRGSRPCGGGSYWGTAGFGAFTVIAFP